MKKYLLLAIISITTFANAQTPNWTWAKAAGGNLHESANSVVVDAMGNSYVTGSFYSPTFTLGATTLHNGTSPNCDIFLAKYDPNGNVIWAKSQAGPGNDVSLAIGVDGAGSVYISGYFVGPFMTFGSVTLANANPGQADIFFAKYDSNGNLKWGKRMGGTASDALYYMAVNSAGDCFLTGYFNSPTIVFGNTTLTYAGVGADFFIAKYDSTGNCSWAKKANGNNNDCGVSIAADNYGFSYVTGLFMSPNITFGTTQLVNTAGNQGDIFVVKYDASGNVVWAKAAGGSSYECGQGITVDNSGNVFVTGIDESQTMNFGSTTITNANYQTVGAIFYAKYDANGNLGWAKEINGTASIWTYSVAADVSGNTYLSGVFSDTLTLGSTVFFNHDTGYSDDIFICKYDNLGNVLWAKSEGENSYDEVYSIATSTAGDVFITGDFVSDSMSFGSNMFYNPDTANTSGQFYLAKLASTVGISEWKNETNFSVFPNPFSSTATLHSDSPLENAILEIYNSSGQKVSEEKNISGETITINRNNLADGIYFIQLIQNNKLIGTGKIIVAVQ